MVEGSQVDRYTVRGVVGGGGHATVYLVEHRILGTRHALKVPRAFDPAVASRLVREGQLQARLDPRHIVPVTDVFLAGGRPALLMPYVDGASLAAVLERLVPDEREVAALVDPILRGIGAAHAAGVVHLDLKPANVLLEVKYGQVEVRVADFGIAALIGDPRAAFAGTPAYASPEQHADAPLGPAADLWAVGAIVYELLTGRRPFPGHGEALRRAVLAADVDLSPVPHEWRPLLRQLLTADPAARLASAEAARQAIAAVVPAPAALTAASRVAAAVHDASLQGTAPAPVAAAATVLPSEVLPSEPSAPPGAELPPERDPFVGRQAELRTLGERVRPGRLVTLVGPGGAGKTRLALQLGRTVPFAGGVWFCDLTDAWEADGIVAAVGRGLGVPLWPHDPVQQLVEALRRRGACLLILDNLEQVVAHAAGTVGRWRDLCPEVAFLATSRQRLGLPGEALVEVPPLDPPAARELFEQRAASVRPGFRAEGPQEPALAELVHLLDGLPLAIELAAARARTLDPTELLDQMTERFRLLADRAAPAGRHASLRATLDWSWRLLTPAEQRVLAQLAVLDGGFDLEALEAIVDAGDDWVVDLAQALVDKSLVRVVAPGWFQLLHSVRAYARDVAGASPGAAGRLVDHYARFGTREALDALDRHGGPERMAVYRRHVPNLRRAVRLAIRAGRHDDATRAALAAWTTYLREGPLRTGQQLLAEVAEPGPSDPSLRASWLQQRANAARMLGEGAEADALEGSARAPADGLGPSLARGEILLNAGTHARAAGDLELAERLATEAEQVLEQLGSDRLLGHARILRGLLETRRGRLGAGQAALEDALRRLRAAGSAQGVSTALYNLGIGHLQARRLAKAEEAFGEARRAYAQARDTRGGALARTYLGVTQLRRGALPEAMRTIDRALAAHRRIGNVRGEADAHRWRGWGSYLSGQPRQAATHLAEARALAQKTQDGSLEGLVGNLEGEIALDRGDLEAARLHLRASRARLAEVGYRQGEASALVLLARRSRLEGQLAEAHARLDEAAALRGPPSLQARIDVERAAVALQEGDVAGAQAHQEAALATFTQVGDPEGAMVVHVARALHHVDEGAWSAARAAADEALATGAHHPVSRALLRWAQAVIASAAGHAAEASEARAAARQIAARLEVGPPAELAQRLRRALPGPAV